MYYCVNLWKIVVNVNEQQYVDSVGNTNECILPDPIELVALSKDM